MYSAKGRQATPYIHDSLKGAHVNFAQAIKNMPKYWNQQVSNPDFKWGAYDVIMTLTEYEKMFYFTYGATKFVKTNIYSADLEMLMCFSCKLFDAKTQTAGTTGERYRKAWIPFWIAFQKPHLLSSKGVAYSSSFCQGKTPAKFTAAGLVNDDIKFGGINTASHELGHM